MISKGDAILALVPNAQFNILNGEVTWLSDALVQPTEEAIVEKIAELEYLEGIESYKEDRAAAYPDWGNQLDYIYHNGVDSWKADIVDPVKTAHPKVNPDSSEIVANPAITKDSEERAAAQATVDATPQEVVDAYNV